MPDPKPSGDEDDPISIEDPHEDQHKNIRYRMSEEFLSGRITMAAESISLTGPDGKPMSADEFVIYQSNALKERFKTLQELNRTWQDVGKRREFEQDAPSMGLDIDALQNIFFEKHKMRNIDFLDVLSNLIFNEQYLTKAERVEKAKILRPEAFNIKGEDSLVLDILDIYKDTGYRSLSFGKEFWQIPKMQKHGGFQGIRNTLGGQNEMMAFVNNLQQAIYDERIIA